MTEGVMPIFRSFKDEHLSYDKITDTYQVGLDIVKGLSDSAIQELLSGSENDLNQMLNVIVEETYGVLYGLGGKIKSSSFYHLDNLTKSIEEQMRINSLNYFIVSVMPDFIINWHHLEWSEAVRNYQYLCIIAARDHGKSFLFSNAYLAWNFYRYERNLAGLKTDQTLSERMMLFSFSMNQAVDLIEILKNTIESNDILKDRLYPDNPSSNWKKEEIRTKNGCRLQGKSFGSSIRGAHPGKIVIDDGLTDAAIYSETQRNKTIQYFHSVIMNAIIPKGQVTVVGTPFHSNDLYGDLKKKKNWHVREYPAIFPDGRMLWENRYDYLSLKDKRESQGNLIFSRELLCKPITSDSTIFPFEILNKSFINMENFSLVNNIQNHKIKFRHVVVGVDLALSSSVGADYTVFVTFGIDDKENRWLINFYREKGVPYNQQKLKLKNINTAFKPDMIMVETNQFQMVLAQDLKAEGLQNIKPHNTGTEKHNLKQGLPSVAVQFEQSKYRIPIGDQRSRDIADLIISEFSSIAFTEKGIEGVGEHDDIPMAWWQAELAARQVTKGFGFMML